MCVLHGNKINPTYFYSLFKSFEKAEYAWEHRFLSNFHLTVSFWFALSKNEKKTCTWKKRLASLDKPSKCLTFNLNFNFSNADGLYYREKRKTLLSRLESILWVLFLMIEFTYGKILKPHNITLQKLLGIPYHNQFVYVIHVMVWLLNTLPNQHRRLLHYVTEIDIAEKIALSKNEHRKGALK